MEEVRSDSSPNTQLLDKKESLNKRVQKFTASFFTAFFIIGIFNNNGYVLVQAGSSSLAKTFHKEDFIGFF